MPIWGQDWNIVYEGDYAPSLPPAAGQDLQGRDLGNPFAPVLQADDGSQVPTASPGYIHYEDSVGASGQKWTEAEAAPDARLNQAFPNGGTMIFRIRRPAGSVGVGDIRSFSVKSSVGDQFSAQVGRDNGLYIETGGTGEGAVDVGNLGSWNVYRVTYQPEGGAFRVKVYVNGSTTAATDTLTASDTSTDEWKMGSSSDGTGEYDLDWLLVTDDGAFQPGTGPLLPAGFDEGYTGPIEPTWTPAPPTATPTVTPTTTPCIAGNICNGGFESGILDPWVSVGPETRDPSGPTNLCTIDPQAGSFMSLHASNYGEVDGSYYQQVVGFPGTAAIFSCYIAVDCNSDHEEYGLIGIDPDGGTDPAAASIVWSDPLDAPGGNTWSKKVLGPVTTTPGSTITVWFQHVHAPGGGTDTFNITAFDSFELEAIGAYTPPPPSTGIKTWDVYH